MLWLHRPTGIEDGIDQGKSRLGRLCQRISFMMAQIGRDRRPVRWLSPIPRVRSCIRRKEGLHFPPDAPSDSGVARKEMRPNRQLSRWATPSERR